MLVICPNLQCHQKVVLVQGYGKLPSVSTGADRLLHFSVDKHRVRLSSQIGEHGKNTAIPICAAGGILYDGTA
jgi:hypothetical protein